jgi:C4-dicarboxylate-binding protein DctP
MSRIWWIVAPSLVTLFAGIQPGVSSEVEIRIAHPYGQDSPIAQDVSRFAELIEGRFGGQVHVELYPAGTIVSLSQSLTSVERGEIDISVSPAGHLASIEPNLRIFTLPFLFNDADSAIAFQRSEAGQSMLSALEDHNVIGIAYWPGNARVVFAADNIIEAESLDGLRLHADPENAPYFAALGARIQSMPSSEVYTALQTGVIDATEFSFNPFYPVLLDEESDTIIASGHQFDTNVLYANSGFWRSLPGDIREGIAEVAMQVAEESVERIAEENQASFTRLEEQGIQIIAPSEQTWQGWRSVAEPLWEEYPGAEIDTRILEAARSGTGGGGDPCPLGTCRTVDRQCTPECR